MNQSFLLLVCFITMSISCTSSKDDLKDMKTYDGPLIELHDIETLYSDSAILRIKLRAPLEYEFQNGDRTFPEGLNLIFYTEYEEVSSTLRSNFGKFDKKTGIYNVTGNVIIKNKLENEQLNCEELNWNPTEQRIFTDKFVRIETPKEILMGEGLDANEDFSKYKILKPTGVFTISE
ncbi:MAG: LPS export ABC transporter periplasmic protein LptC [Cytophagales bacterium]|nr:LPS export ABC transporter periplasmic protein LptC [Cytophagales bacterium]